MIVLLLKIIFFSLSELSDIVSYIIFNVIARLLVILVQAFSVPGQAIQGALEQVKSLAGVCLDYFVEFVLEATKSLIAAILDNLKEIISSSAAAIVSLIRNGLMEDLPEVLEGLKDMVSTMVVDFLNNYVNAVGYVWNNFVNAVAYVTENT